MGDTGPDTAQKQTAWPSIDHAKPNEEGGPIARTGFNYQDEIAVGFLIEMLETPALLKVHCETHDDVVLIRQSEASPKRVVEYVQVKASGQDKLWSVVDLCKRKKAKAGTSIFEISLGRDKHDEASIFRLVTLRPVVRALEPLTHPFTARSCLSSSEGLKALCTEFDRRFPGITSPKGNGASFWVDNCLWDQRHSEEAVRKDNLIRLIKLGAKEGRPRLMVEPAEVLLLELRAMAKAAGDAKWDPDRDKKIILRETLRAWWQQRTYELTERETVDGVILDLMLNGETSLPFADELMNRGTPVILATGYAQSHLPKRYSQLPQLSKPVRETALIRLIEHTFRR